MSVRRSAATVFGLIALVGCVKTPPPSAPTLAVPVADVASSAQHAAPFDRRFAQGDRVEVLWNGRWWPAVVLESRPNHWLVHYEGYADEWDETVDVDRIRERGLETFGTTSEEEDLPENDP